MLKNVKRLGKALKQTPQMRQVVCDDSGFTVVEDGKTLARVLWTEILEIFAYKEDRGTYDDICLGFRVSDDGTFWMISEEFIGYKNVVAELERRFLGIRTDWFAEVAFPAFALNRTTLWGQTWRERQT